jgi:hypothetical protein
MKKYTHYVIPVLPRIDPTKLRIGDWIKRDDGAWLSVEKVKKVKGRIKVIGIGPQFQPVEAWADECREAWDPDKHWDLAKKEALKNRKVAKDENGDINGNLK